MSNTPIPMYNPAEIEPQWQENWETDGLYQF